MTTASMVTLLPACWSSDTGIQSAQAAAIVCHSLCSMARVFSWTRPSNPEESRVAVRGNTKSSSEVMVSGVTPASTSWFLGTYFPPTGDTAPYRGLWFSAYTASRSSARSLRVLPLRWHFSYAFSRSFHHSIRSASSDAAANLKILALHPHLPCWEQGPLVISYVVWDSMPVDQILCKPLETCIVAMAAALRLGKANPYSNKCPFMWEWISVFRDARGPIILLITGGPPQGTEPYKGLGTGLWQVAYSKAVTARPALICGSPCHWAHA